MVTIEQKILLFSKLLHQSMDDKYKIEMEKLEKEYSLKIQKNEDEVDKEVDLVESKAKKKAEAQSIESISKTKMSIKKEIMLIKEKYFDKLMLKLKNRALIFTETENYQDYLLFLIEKIQKENSKNIVVYLNKKDNEKYSKLIKDSIINLGYGYEDITFNLLKENIIGGFVIEYPKENFRINLTLDSILEDNKMYIMQTLFESLEAGENYDI